MSTEEKLVAELSAIGIHVNSVWDLVNGPNNYKEALPILMKYLQEAEESWFKEGVVRAMAVKDFSVATPILIKEFYKAKDESYKWAIGSTLGTIAPKNSINQLIDIMGDFRHGRARQMITEALGRFGDKKSIPVLLKSLEDENVAGHAIKALGKLGDDETVVEEIKPFKKHKMKWIRNAATRAIKEIQKRMNKKKLE